MLSKLKDEELISGVKALVGEEKKILQQILEYLHEIESRRLYALRGYPSLHDFCVRELGYSDASAQRRISAMFLIKTLPEAKDKFELGTVNLSTLSQLQCFIRKEESLKNTKLDHTQRLELLTVIENKSQKECKREFVKLSPEAVKQESIRPVTSELTEIKLTISKDLELKLNELKDLLSHQNKTGSMAGLVEVMADRVLQDLRKEKPQKTEDHLAKEKKLGESHSAAEQGNSKLSLRAIKRHVYRRDQGECQYVDPLTKRKCKSRHRIQFDHIYPRGLGGGDTIDNLQLLCQSHNILRATQVYSKKHMKQYLRQ